MIKPILKKMASDILKKPSIEAKISAALLIGEITKLIGNNEKKLSLMIEKYSDQSEYSATIPDSPARPRDFVLDPDKEKKFNLIEDSHQRILSIIDSAYVDVEINAMEASAALFLMEEDLPLDFFKDFGSHIYDEGMHALYLKELTLAFPEYQSSKTYSNRVWNKVSKGKTIVERIMIENVIEEGWAADRTVGFIEMLSQDARYKEITSVFEKINNDEMRHASIGIKWVKILTQSNEDDFLNLFDQVSTTYNPSARSIESIKTRLASGFSPKFVKKYF